MPVFYCFSLNAKDLSDNCLKEVKLNVSVY